MAGEVRRCNEVVRDLVLVLVADVAPAEVFRRLSEVAAVEGVRLPEWPTFKRNLCRWESGTVTVLGRDVTRDRDAVQERGKVASETTAADEDVDVREQVVVVDEVVVANLRGDPVEPRGDVVLAASAVAILRR